MRYTASLFVLILTAGCVGDTTDYDLYGDYPCLTPGPDVGNRALQNDPDYRWDLNDEFAAMAREIPGGFGGYFYARPRQGSTTPGPLTFYLVDMSQASEAAAALADYGLGGGGQAIRGDYDFLQLKSCYDALRVNPDVNIWQIDEVVGTGIAHDLNRIILDVTDLGREPALRAIIDSVRVPQGMVRIEYGEPGQALPGARSP